MKKINLLTIFIAICSLFIACNNYGDKVEAGHVEVYYKDGINKTEAQKTADLFFDVDINAGNPEVKKSLQLCKINDTICMRMIVNSNYNSAYDKSMMALANFISDSVFKSAPVNLDLTDNQFKSKKFIHYKKD